MHSGRVVPFGRTFLVIGGWNKYQNVYHNRVFKIDPDTLEWIRMPLNIKVPRMYFYASLVEDEMVKCN